MQQEGKRGGGAVGLTDNPSALQRWLVAGPEVTVLIKDFEDTHQLMGRRHEVIHHDQKANVQNAFRKDVCSLDNVMEELANPLEEESEDLLIIDSKEIANPSAVEAVKKAQKISQQHFQTFTKECLVDRTKPIDDTIHRNRLKLFIGSRTKTASKEKQQLSSIKSDVSCSHDSTLAVKREMAIWKTSFRKRTKHGQQRSPMEEDYDLVPRVTS